MCRVNALELFTVEVFHFINIIHVSTLVLMQSQSTLSFCIMVTILIVLFS